MTDLFLKAKHWQLFILTFGILMIFQIVMIITMFSNFSTQLPSPPDPTIMFGHMKYFPMLMIVFMGIYFGWFWSVAIGLQAKVPAHVSMKVNRFKIFFIIPMVYLALFFVGIVVLLNGMIEFDSIPHVGLIAVLFALAVPLHLFSIFCIFHSIYFIAKTFKTVELQREVTFSDFVGEFFLIWFFPIGVWIIQPQINKMIES